MRRVGWTLLSFVLGAVGLALACSHTNFQNGGGDTDAGASADGASPEAGGGDGGTTSCSERPGEVVVRALHTNTSTTLSFGDAGDGTLLHRGYCPQGPDSYTLPTVVVTMFNATGASGTVSLWPICGSGNGNSTDVTLSVYKRDTPPREPDEIPACDGFSASDFTGKAPVDNNSPEGNGSGWCNALMADAGLGIPIAACGRMVVRVQQYDNGAPPPAGLRFRID